MPAVDIMAAARRTIHRTFGDEALYSHPLYTKVAKTVHVRWHNKLALEGNLNGDGYASVVEGVNRLIFNVEELAQQNIELHKGGRVELVSSLYKGAVLILDSSERMIGPIEQVWNAGPT